MSSLPFTTKSMALTEQCSKLAKLPADMVFMILDCLLDCDPSHETSKALLALSLTCRQLSYLINAWSTFPTTSANVRLPDGTLLPAPYFNNAQKLQLVDICKRLGWICATCNHRARMYPWIEPFTNLQICMGCDAYRFPKVSLWHIKEFYHCVGEDWAELGNLESRALFRSSISDSTSRHKGLIFRRQDFNGLVAKGKFVRVSNPSQPKVAIRVLLEANGLFELGEPIMSATSSIIDNLSSAMLLVWPNRNDGERIRHRVLVLLCYLGLKFYPGCRTSASFGFPFDNNWDEILFDQFRFQFEPHWRLDSIERKHDYYTSCAAERIGNGMWEHRPWSPDHFPLSPSWKLDGNTSPSWMVRPILDPSWPNFLGVDNDRKLYGDLVSRLCSGLQLFRDCLKVPSLWTPPNRQLSRSSWLSKLCQAAEGWTPQAPRIIKFSLEMENFYSYDIALVERETGVSAPVGGFPQTYGSFSVQV
jgi:hypothetical protein